MTDIRLKYRRQWIRAVVRPANSVWDAFQTTTTRDAQGHEKGRGGFQIGDFRIFAEDLTAAKMLARRIA